MFLIASPEFENGEFVSITEVNVKKKEISFQVFGNRLNGKPIVCSIPDITPEQLRLANKKLRVLEQVVHQTVQIA